MTLIYEISTIFSELFNTNKIATITDVIVAILNIYYKLIFNKEAI